MKSLFFFILFCGISTVARAVPATPSFSPSPAASAPASVTPSATQSSLATPLDSPHPSGEEGQSPLRSKTLELAGAFSNDGYKIRDGFWLAKLPPIGKASLIAVNLFAGNQYWFCVATAPPAQRISLKLYNEMGQPVSSQFYEKNSTIALGVEPSNSGKYYLGVQLQAGAPTNFCVLYTYK